MTPPIGVPRVYDGPECPLIYPGEVASAVFDVAVITAQAAQVQRGEISAPVNMPVAQWRVDPAPGWRARVARARYRLWGQWFSRGAPKLEVDVDVRPRDRVNS